MNNLDSFSLFEMLIVLFIMSLMVLMPINPDSSLQKAQEQIINDLRFLRNLASKDNRQMLRSFDKPYTQAQRANVEQAEFQLWRLQFHTISNRIEGYVGTTYSIFAKRARRNGDIDNKPMGFVSIARNPFNGKCLSWYNYGDLPLVCRDIRDERLKLEERFGITHIYFEWNTKGCAPIYKTIYFDSHGQAYCGSSKLIKVAKNARLWIESKRGKVHIQLSDL